MMDERGLPVTTIRGRPFRWGQRTFVMGILNVTPDSFSGDGLLVPGTDPIAAAVAQARGLVADGADLLDIGGESSRPGHTVVDPDEELARVVPVVVAVRAALPEVPISIDTTKPTVARAALDAGADLLNDVWGVDPASGMTGLAAERDVPIVLMHNRLEPTYIDVVDEVIDALRLAVDRAAAAGIPDEHVLVDPGIGFGKTAEHNLALLGHLDALRTLGRPSLLGTSRKSTLGRLLDLPAPERVEATLATTALAVAARVDVVRVHDVRANVRAARVADAVVRGWRPDGWTDTGSAGSSSARRDADPAEAAGSTPSRPRRPGRGDRS